MLSLLIAVNDSKRLDYAKQEILLKEEFRILNLSRYSNLFNLGKAESKSGVIKLVNNSKNYGTGLNADVSGVSSYKYG